MDRAFENDTRTTSGAVATRTAITEAGSAPASGTDRDVNQGGKGSRHKRPRYAALIALGAGALGAAALGAGCGAAPTDEGAVETDEAPAFAEPIAETGQAATTCVTIERGVLGQVSDTQIASNSDGLHPSGNFGAGLAMIAGTVGPGVRETLLRFDLSSIPSGATIAAALLTLQARASSNSGPGVQLGVHAITSPWSESTVTWATAPSFNPAPVATDAGGPGTHTFDVTSLATGWISGSNNGVLLEQSGPYNTNFYTSESPSVAERPRLEVCYTPAACGSPAPCLDPSVLGGLFTLEDATLCPVAVYTADEALMTPYGTALPLTWGSHGGPLEFIDPYTGTSVSLKRWSVPGVGTALTSATTTVPVAVPPMSYLGGAANDLPFFGATAISWTGGMFPFTGDVALIQAGAVASTYSVNAVYSLATLGTDAATGRLLYTGGSPLGSSAGFVNGFFGADACAGSALATVGNAGCQPVLIAEWGEASGPVAVDSAGNAIVAMAVFSAGKNDVRAFPAASVARGAPATAPTALCEIPGSADSMAALAPTACADGILAFQANDAFTFSPVAGVVEQRYATSGGAIQAIGTPAPLLTLATAGPVDLITDDQDRLWVGVPSMATNSTTFVVLARK